MRATPALFALLAGCAGPAAPATLPVADGALEADLADVRAWWPSESWAATVRVSIRDAATGRAMEGRGVLAVSPGRAVRLVLLGGPGMTVLDAWVTPRSWRIHVPPAQLTRRGAEDAPSELPVEFFRWWFLSGLAGELVGGRHTPEGPAWWLRDGGAVVALRASSDPGARRLSAVRRQGGRSEHVAEVRASGVPGPGDVADYDDDRGLRVHVEVEGRSGAPGPEAFVDPDAPEAPR